MARVHPTALVDPAAKLADDAEVGAYSVVGRGVELGPGVRLGPHVVVSGRTIIGARTRVFSFAALGGPPQLRAGAEPTGLLIGADNVLREHVSVHAGSRAGGTVLGDGNLLLNAAHVGHDCRIGSGCEIGSQTGLAGHVEIFDGAVVGAQVGVHQFCRIGRGAYVGASGKLNQDVAPFAKVVGRRPRCAGVNEAALERLGLPSARRQALRRAFHLIFRARLPRAEALERVRRECGDGGELSELVDFVAGSTRGVTR